MSIDSSRMRGAVSRLQRRLLLNGRFWATWIGGAIIGSLVGSATTHHADRKVIDQQRDALIAFTHRVQQMDREQGPGGLTMGDLYLDTTAEPGEPELFMWAEGKWRCISRATLERDGMLWFDIETKELWWTDDSTGVETQIRMAP